MDRATRNEPVNQSREELLAQVAYGLRELAEKQAFIETATPEELEQLQLGDSYISYVQGVLSLVEMYYGPGLDGGIRTSRAANSWDITRFDGFVWSKIGQAAFDSKWGDDLKKLEDLGGNVFNYDFSSYAALSHSRKVLMKSDDPIVRLFGLAVPAYLAAYYRPDDFDPSHPPRKHKNETDEDVLFRTAYNDLSKIAAWGSKTEVKKVAKVCNQLQDKDNQRYELLSSALARPENAQIANSFNDWQLALSAKILLNGLSDPVVNPDRFKEDMAIAMKIRQKRRQERQKIEVEIEETIWTILPPGTMEDIEAGVQTGSGNGENIQFVDPERMRWLARLAIEWGPEAYIAIANLDRAGHFDYRAAILPQHIGGVTVEHAIAENPSSGNAIYAFRAERGLDDATQTTWMTWRDVLSRTKPEARLLGARRILHGVFVNENVLEYLTRPPDDLEKPNYHR